MDFSKFSKAVSKQFDDMQEGKLYKVCVDSDLLYQTYLNAFPDGTNDIYRENSYHDCSCCRHFIKNVGKVVSIKDGQLTTVWDVDCNEYPYDIVAKTMSDFIKEHHVQNMFLVKFNKFGNEFNLELMPDNTTHRWDHFVGNVQRKFIDQNPSEKLSEIQSEFQVFKRGLDELTLSSIDTVIDLIEDNMIYRGEEHLSLIKSFRELKIKYDSVTYNDKDLFIWENLGTPAVNRFRNTVIGTLVVDLSNGEDLEQSVKSFENKVAPSNYKRPKSLITPKMIDDAMNTITELGYEPALERRHATYSDVSISDVLFVDNSVKEQMQGIRGELFKTVKPKSVDVKNSLDISIDEFLSSVLPNAHTVQALVKNTNVGNFMSLTAPVNKDVKNIFKWDNNFAWSYDGNIADSDIKTRVKSAGGNVDALIRCSLAWFNYDDLDIHMILPNGTRVYYSNKMDILDVDMNAGSGTTRNAVENLSLTEKNISDGTYVVRVNNFSKRESIDVGFTLEVEFDGNIKTYHYNKPVIDTIQCLELIVKNKALVDVKVLDGDIISEEVSQNKWGVNTETFVDVTSIIQSPNYWGDNKSGNRHTFFILKDCKNPDSIRGIYNEFLSPELEKHRKVFEIIGEKTKCQYSEEQMSGIGFSSTKKQDLTLRVDNGNIKQVYNVKF